MNRPDLSRRHFGRVSIATAMGAVAFASAGPAQAAPRAELWSRWTAHDPNSSLTVDHGTWDFFTRRYVSHGSNGVALVNYAAVGAEDKAALGTYLRSLAGTQVSSLNQREQYAYWLNLYNALTVKVILDRFPVYSIRDIDISPGLFSNGPWGAKLISIEGEQISLDDIEHRILRPIWRDPRIHYGVNCASIGCPDLLMGAFTADNLDNMLNQAAVNFINHPRAAQVQGSQVFVSSIYDWFEDDFGGSDAGVIAHLRQYAQPALASQLASVTSVGGDDYDWALNALSAERATQRVPRATTLGVPRTNTYQGSGTRGFRSFDSGSSFGGGGYRGS